LSNIKKECKYSEDHEWALLEDGIVTIGISDHAQNELGDIVFVELPECDEECSLGDSIGTIEAVKTVADIYVPVGGTVVEVNEELEDTAESLNNDPYGKGWIAKIKVEDSSDFDSLMSPEEYEEFTK
jgi:glycine cleavage system H protein